MKLPGDPWNNRWSSFYGIAWNFSMEFHRKCPNPPWKISMQKFPWNSMEIGVLMFSMEFHGKCPNPPCKYFPWKSMEKFPWNSMEIDVQILHGIPWRIFHGNLWNSLPWRFFTLAIALYAQARQSPQQSLLLLTQGNIYNRLRFLNNILCSKRN